MRKRKAKSTAGQLELFPEARRPTGKEFAAKLQGMALISKRVKRRKPKEGQPKTINVSKEVENAYSFLEGLQGVNVAELIKVLQKVKRLDVDITLHNKEIFAQLQRSRAEQAAIKKAVALIARFVNRKKRLDELHKMHSLTPQQYAERRQMQQHLKGVGKGG